MSAELAASGGGRISDDEEGRGEGAHGRHELKRFIVCGWSEAGGDSRGDVEGESARRGGSGRTRRSGADHHHERHKRLYQSYPHPVQSLPLSPDNKREGEVDCLRKSSSPPSSSHCSPRSRPNDPYDPHCVSCSPSSRTATCANLLQTVPVPFASSSPAPLPVPPSSLPQSAKLEVLAMPTEPSTHSRLLSA